MKPTICPWCRGEGGVVGRLCRQCRGDGFLPAWKVIVFGAPIKVCSCGRGWSKVPEGAKRNEEGVWWTCACDSTVFLPTAKEHDATRAKYEQIRAVLLVIGAAVALAVGAVGCGAELRQNAWFDPLGGPVAAGTWGCQDAVRLRAVRCAVAKDGSAYCEPAPYVVTIAHPEDLPSFLPELPGVPGFPKP